MDNNTVYSTHVSSGEQGSVGFPDRTSTLAVVPPQLSPEYAAEVVSELCQTRAELCMEKALVEPLRSVLAFPFCALDEARRVWLDFAGDNRERLEVVEAGAGIIRHDAWK